MGIFKDCLERGWVLILADAARSRERSKQLYPSLNGWDLHVAGRAIDVSFVGMSFQPGWTIKGFDAICESHGFFPLGASRFANPATGQKGDPNHYDLADCSSKHQVGTQRFKSIEEAANWVGNAA